MFDFKVDILNKTQNIWCFWRTELV